MNRAPTLMLYAGGAIAIGVFALMIGSIVAFHRSTRPAANDSQSALVEILWSMVSITIIVALVLPAVYAIVRR